ncbi:MAG: hypothetical protein COA92_01685 [Sulfurovum sp.]|nr:MAG: hypothetical protein COA92_01685 [Sulfurovum sp.]
MPIELYSDTQRNLQKNNIFIYDNIPQKFKNNMFNFIRKHLTLGQLVVLYREILIERGIKRTIGESYLQNPSAFLDIFISAFEKFIDEVEKDDEVSFHMDFIAIFLNMTNNENIVNDVNTIFYKYSLGYQIDTIKNQIMRVDSKIIYKETTTKVLHLLNDTKFENADDEYREAYEKFKSADYENVLVEANKAFETTMKIICELKGYGLPKKHTASALIAHLKMNDFIENFQTDKFNGLAKTLESVSIVRNNQGGHGQGAIKRDLHTMYAEYALQVTASNIILLIGIYNESL